MDEEGGSQVIGPQQLAIGLGSGALLIVLGLVPGLFADLVMGVQNAIASVSGEQQDELEVPNPRWLAGVGAWLVVMVLLLY